MRPIAAARRRLAPQKDRARSAIVRRTGLPNIAHLARFDEIPDGPLQRDEALLLFSLVRVLRPQTVVEIGFLRGDSAHNFLEALDADGRLYSFDIDPECERVATERFEDDDRFVFRVRSQDALEPSDIDGRQADFVFLDASHDLALNQRTFECLLPLMAPRALLAVHDTGTMPRRLVPDGHWWHRVDDGWVGDEREVMPDERAFMNWLLDEHGEFAQVHLHTLRTMRCGLTFLQRSAPLQRAPQSGRARSTR